MTKLTQRPEIPTDIKEIATDGGIATLILTIKHIVANLSDTESQSLQALFSSMEGCSNFFFSAAVLRIIDLGIGTQGEKIVDGFTTQTWMQRGVFLFLLGLVMTKNPVFAGLALACLSYPEIHKPK